MRTEINIEQIGSANIQPANYIVLPLLNIAINIWHTQLDVKDANGWWDSRYHWATDM